MVKVYHNLASDGTFVLDIYEFLFYISQSMELLTPKQYEKFFEVSNGQAVDKLVRKLHGHNFALSPHLLLNEATMYYATRNLAPDVDLVLPQVRSLDSTRRVHDNMLEVYGECIDGQMDTELRQLDTLALTARVDTVRDLLTRKYGRKNPMSPPHLQRGVPRVELWDYVREASFGNEPIRRQLDPGISPQVNGMLVSNLEACIGFAVEHAAMDASGPNPAKDYLDMFFDGNFPIGLKDKRTPLFVTL